MGEQQSPGPDPDESDAETRCLVCETAIESDQFRVVTAVEGGDAVHRYLCGDDCVERWRAARRA